MGDVRYIYSVYSIFSQSACLVSISCQRICKRPVNDYLQSSMPAMLYVEAYVYFSLRETCNTHKHLMHKMWLCGFLFLLMECLLMCLVLSHWSSDLVKIWHILVAKIPLYALSQVSWTRCITVTKICICNAESSFRWVWFWTRELLQGVSIACYVYGKSVHPFVGHILLSDQNNAS